MTHARPFSADARFAVKNPAATCNLRLLDYLGGYSSLRKRGCLMHEVTRILSAMDQGDPPAGRRGHSPNSCRTDPPEEGYQAGLRAGQG